MVTELMIILSRGSEIALNPPTGGIYQQRGKLVNIVGVVYLFYDGLSMTST